MWFFCNTTAADEVATGGGGGRGKWGKKAARGGGSGGGRGGGPIRGRKAKPADGLAVWDEQALSVHADSESEILLFDLPPV